MITAVSILAFAFILVYATRSFASYRRRSRRRWLRGAKSFDQGSHASHVLRMAKTVELGWSAVVLFITGTFIYFAHAVYGSARLPSAHADAIVALSGDPERIRAAVDLLAKGYGRRLLIAGIDNSAEIAELYPVHRALFDCCVDIDPRSIRSIDDAATIRRWALEVRPRSEGQDPPAAGPVTPGGGPPARHLGPAGR